MARPIFTRALAANPRLQPDEVNQSVADSTRIFGGVQLRTNLDHVSLVYPQNRAPHGNPDLRRQGAYLAEFGEPDN